MVEATVTGIGAVAGVLVADVLFAGRPGEVGALAAKGAWAGVVKDVWPWGVTVAVDTTKGDKGAAVGLASGAAAVSEAI